MTQQRILESLTTLFANHPVVFWHDVDGEFAPLVAGLQLGGVQLVHLDDTPALRIKLDIDRAPDQRWLIYSAKPEPEPVKDWLLAQSPDKPTRRNVTLNPQTPKEVLLQLAPTFAGEFFLNPAFDFLLMEDPNLLFSMPVGVLKNILKREDCPFSLLNWATKCGDKSHHLAVVSRTDLSKEMLQRIADGPHVKAAELAAGRLLAGDFKS